MLDRIRQLSDEKLRDIKLERMTADRQPSGAGMVVLFCICLFAFVVIVRMAVLP